jgi:hypothetical protein
MAGIGLQAVESLPDALGTWRYELDIAPGANSDTDTVMALKLRCQQCDFAGVTVETMLVALHGHEMNFRGRQTFSKTMSISFVATRDGEPLNSLYTWKEKVVGTRSGNGAYKAEYAALGVTSILDVSGKLALGQRIFYMFPTEISNIQLDSSGSSLMLVQTTFSFDFMQMRGPNGDWQLDTHGEAATM